MKLRLSTLNKLSVFLIIFALGLFYGCGGSGSKTDMSNLPDLKNVSSENNINFTEISSLGQIATFGDITMIIILILLQVTPGQDPKTHLFI